MIIKFIDDKNKKNSLLKNRDDLINYFNNTLSNEDSLVLNIRDDAVDSRYSNRSHSHTPAFHGHGVRYKFTNHEESKDFTKEFKQMAVVSATGERGILILNDWVHCSCYPR